MDDAPLPPPPPSSSSSSLSSQGRCDLRRLWVGNLDQRVTEFALLKILRPYGSVGQFDLLVHKAGPLKGLPRGYAFVTFETEEEAKKAVHSLDGMRLLDRRLAVSYAHDAPSNAGPTPAPAALGGAHINVTASLAAAAAPTAPGRAASGGGTSGTGGGGGQSDVNSQIRAIEAKLKAMKERSDADVVARVLSTAGNSSSQQNHLSIAQQMNLAAGRDARPGSSMVRNGGFAARHAHRRPYNRRGGRR